MSEDNKPIEVEAKAPVDEVKTEERVTGEMPVVATPSESDAPKMPASASSAPEPESPSKAVAPTSEAKPATSEKPDTSEKTPETDKKANVDKPADEPSRAARTTVAMPVVLDVGAPPAVPGDVEEPTHMPSPEDVPTSGSPSDAAKAPGRVPSGDSRSLRAGGQFALIYRRGTAVITRFGTVGQRGQWRVVEYPTPSSASNAYAKECSRFVGEGFSDYRD